MSSNFSNKIHTLWCSCWLRGSLWHANSLQGILCLLCSRCGWCLWWTNEANKQKNQNRIKPKRSARVQKLTHRCISFWFFSCCIGNRFIGWSFAHFHTKWIQFGCDYLVGICCGLLLLLLWRQRLRYYVCVSFVDILTCHHLRFSLCYNWLVWCFWLWCLCRHEYFWLATSIIVVIIVYLSRIRRYCWRSIWSFWRFQCCKSHVWAWVCGICRSKT